jgi:glutaminase
VVDAKANLGELVDLFYQLCSVETTCQGLAAIAATLANAGTSPLTAKYLFFFFALFFFLFPFLFDLQC